MPVRKNGYYQADPALSASFDNLAEAFKTPSGTDVYGYTKATAEREKAARLADLYKYAQSPGYDQTLADRLAVGAGQYTPNQSYYAVDEGNDTTLKTNAATNAATLAVADKNNAGALARQFANPVIVDGIAYLPKQTQAATGLPEMFRGNITAKQGETITTPAGEVFKGTPKPLTDSEMKASILGRLPENEQRAVAMQGVDTTPVLDAKGEPTLVLAPDAAGRTPYNVDTRQPQIANYKAPGGASGTAVLDKDTGKWKDTQTGQELPPGIQTYTANLQGDKNQTGLGAAGVNRAEEMLVNLSLAENTSKQFRSLISANPSVLGAAGAIRGSVQDVIAAGGEVGKLFNMNIDQMKKDIAEGRVDPEVAKKFNFDPAIPAAHLYETLLTAQVAKVLDPNGRLSNQLYNKVASDVGSGWLGNSSRTTSVLDAFDKIIAGQRDVLAPVAPAAAKLGQTPRPSATPTPAPSSSAPEVWERGPDGQLRRAQ